MKQFADSFALLPEAEATAARLTASVPHFAHLAEARLLFVASQRQPVLHGSPCQACVVRPYVQGPLRWLFDWMVASLGRERFQWDEPDYVILFDAALFQSYDETKREWLVYHELRHIEQQTEHETGIPKFSKEDGRPVWRLVPHDAEFFFDEVERYGPEVAGQIEATIALATGARAAQIRDAEAADSGAAVRAHAGDGSVRRPLRGGDRQ